MIAMFLLCLLFLCQRSHGAGWSPTDHPVVILRIDNVAVRSCEEMARVAINAVLAKNTPINVGVIAKDLDKETHSDFAEYLNTIAANVLVEISSNSYSHETYTEEDFAWQVNDMNTAQTVLNSITNTVPTSFIPPLNTFNSDTLEAMVKVEAQKVFSAQCIWDQDAPGRVANCPAPGSVSAPDVFVGGSYHLPAGAVLGDLDYWENKIQPGNLTEAIKWIDSQILNQNFSVLLLHPSEFSTSTECVSIDNDKVALLESLIDYGVGKYQFMTFQQAAMYFTNDTSLFDPASDRDNAKFEFQAKLNLFFVFIFTGVVLIVACLSFCRTSTEQKIQRKDRVAAELKRKKDIDSKLQYQRKQREIEMPTSPQHHASHTNGKKKANGADYSIL